MASSRSTSLTLPLGLKCLAVDLSHMVWLRSLPKYSNSWLPGPHTTSTLPKTLLKQIKHITLGPGECLSSYDVSSLFTSVPVDPAPNIIKDLLDKDYTLKERTILPVNDIILLLEFCLKNTYFSFQDQFYEQVEGAAMGSPVSCIVANLYMEYLDQKALSTAPTP